MSKDVVDDDKLVASDWCVGCLGASYADMVMLAKVLLVRKRTCRAQVTCAPFLAFKEYDDELEYLRRRWDLGADVLYLMGGSKMHFNVVRPSWTKEGIIRG